MRSVFHKINQVLSGFCGWLMVAMMVLLVIDIVTRTIKKPLQGMAELSVFVMMVVIYLGLARCEEHKDHVTIELIKNAFPLPVRRGVTRVVYFLALLTSGVLLFVVAQNAVVSFTHNESIEGTVELRIWPVKFIMVIGLVFYFIQILINAIDEVKKKRDPSSGG